MSADAGFGRRAGLLETPADLHELAFASGRRSLELLRAIEDAISVLANVVEDAQAIAARNRDLARRTRALRPGKVTLDADDGLDDLFCRVQATARSLHGRYLVARQRAADDKSVPDDDGLVQAYDDAIAATRDIFESCEELRMAVREFDADSSPLSEPISDIDQFLADLKN